MAIDLYTKAVLTVIAACLIVLSARDFALVEDAQAQQYTPPAPQRWGGGNEPKYDGYGNLKVRVAEPTHGSHLNVSVGDWSAGPIQVHCTNCD